MPGFGSRIGAFLVDLVAVHAVFLVGAATVGLVLALVNVTPSHLLAEAIATAGWLAVLAAYFAGFWATAGQTPGMALLCMRVVDPGGGIPGWGRSLVRLAGGLIAITFIFIGFLPVLVDDRRRALPDFLARTDVVYESDPLPATTPARRRTAFTCSTGLRWGTGGRRGRREGGRRRRRWRGRRRARRPRRVVGARWPSVWCVA